MGKVRVKFPFLASAVCLVGADVAGKPNFEALAWFNFVGSRLMGVSSDRSHYTNRGIRENGTFSVNIPSSKMAAATDYCGLHSGGEVDKSGVFDVFYGELKSAPMIKECPVNIECRLKQTLELSEGGEFLVAEVVAVYVDDACFSGGKLDLRKVDPLLFEGFLGDYWKLGEHVAKAYSVGKDYKPRLRGKKGD